MEGYTTPEDYVDPSFLMGEDDEDGVLRFWASHPEDLDELLASLPPLGDETVNSPAPPPPPPQESTYRTWAPVEDVQVVAGDGGVIGSHDMISSAVGGGDVAAMVGQAATGGIPVGLAASIVAPRAGGIPALTMVADFWIPYSGPDCTVCCVVRDIIHTNDRFSMKLSIHGNLGFVDHALLVVHHFLNEIVEEKFIADLSSMDVASLRQFFVDYGYCCYRLGQVLVMDTHRELYNVLAVNMDAIDEDLPADAAGLQAHHDELAALVAPLSPELSYPGLTTQAGHLPPAAASLDSAASEAAGAETGDNLKAVVAALLWAVPELRLLLPLPAAVVEEPEPSSPPNYLMLDPDEDDLYLQRSWGLHSTVRRVAGLGTTALGVHQMVIRKTGIAAQRERTGLLEFGDIARVFHLPITYAARELQICTTALKKVCRRYHVYRWPHRKVLSSAKRIDSLKESLKVQKGLESARTLCLLYAERRELRILYRVKNMKKSYSLRAVQQVKLF